MMQGLSQACHFCEQPATGLMDIAYADGSIIERAVCSWHERFFSDIYEILGRSARTRMAIHDVKESGGRSWNS